MRKLDTHFYDGQLHDLYQQIISLTPTPISLETAYQEIAELINTSLSPTTRQQTHQVLNILKNDRDKSANYDTANRINVDHLLPLVWTKVREYDTSGKLLFLEQLREMRGGLCAQGRTTRLIQMVEIPVPSKVDESSPKILDQKGI